MVMIMMIMTMKLLQNSNDTIIVLRELLMRVKIKEKGGVR